LEGGEGSRPPTPSSSIYAFSPFKSGSTLLFNSLELMSAPIFLNRTYHSAYDLSFNKYGDTVKWLTIPEERSVLTNERHIFGGFRDADPFAAEESTDIVIPIIDNLAFEGKSAIFVFLYRDPRDCLVSLYYSHLKSHAVPFNAEYLEDARRRTSKMTIEDYIQENADSFLHSVTKMVHLADSARMAGFSVLEFSYEAVILEQYKMLSEISAIAGYSLSKTKWAELLRRSRDPSIGCSTPIDFIPDSEDINRHIRKALPGDHRSKLSLGFSEELSLYFSAYLSKLATLNPIYQY
jgi:hypothetical protein